MFLEYAENVIQLLAALSGLLVCLFRYISDKNRVWIYATVFYLSTLLSNYYWTEYLIVMGTYPNVSNLFSYAGWNISFFVLLLLLWYVKSGEEMKFFHPLMLLPIPLNIAQLFIYLPFGGLASNLYQVAVMTGIAVLSLQGILYYRKNKSKGAKIPYVACAALLYAFAEFGMWTSSCFDAPIGTLYYPFSFLTSFALLAIASALSRTFKREDIEPGDVIREKYQRILKGVYLFVVFVCCIGGILLGVWMRDKMRASIDVGTESSLYDIITVVLFIISLFLAAASIAVIFIVIFSEQVQENNELREARRIAEHSNEAKGEFLANMSHEIRTPINAVLGMNEMILRESLQARDLLPKEREVIRKVFADISGYAGNIRSAGNSLLSIINDILDFSKIEAGKLEITENNYRLSSVLNDVSNMIAFRAREKDLNFEVNVDPSIPDLLYGDEVRVRQIMTNVLNNAVKYTEEGCVSLSVENASETPVKENEPIVLLCTVKDTGIGIREEDIARLFEKFERVDLDRNSTVEGTGLGLAITKSLLDLMGGTIEVESEYGRGSVFSMRIPQKVIRLEPVGDFEEKFRRSLEETDPNRKTFLARDAHILIVDDTRMNLMVAANLLKNTEIEIDTASSGAEAISLAETIPYDLILMDQRMPGMDGTEAMNLIRAQENGKNRNTPFICLTADAISGARERYIAEGFTDYLCKPANSYALEGILLKYLPKEKIVFTEQDKEETSSSEDFDVLKEAGIDPSLGLHYCQDRDLYRELLEEFVRDYKESRENLENLHGSKEFKAYAVLAHALKTKARMIGAASLSDSFAALEKAADQNAVSPSMHADVMRAYEETVRKIQSSMNFEDKTAAPSDDGEILEFLLEEEPSKEVSRP